MRHSQILQTLRALRVLILHPPDSEGQGLLDQLVRIGCRAETLWPPTKIIHDEIDIIFLLVEDKIPDVVNSMLHEFGDVRPTLIGIAGYESPSVLKNVIDLQMNGVLSKPLRANGILTSVVLARTVWLEQRRLCDKIMKLSEKLRNERLLDRAKAILMKVHSISEDDAYTRIRSQAMAKRVTTIEIAQSIINAADILGDLTKK